MNELELDNLEKCFFGDNDFMVLPKLLLIYYGGTIFRTSGLTLKELFIMILISSTVIPVDFIRKYILKKKGINTGV